jgi:hypothetical protein
MQTLYREGTDKFGARRFDVYRPEAEREAVYRNSIKTIAN